MHKKLYAIVLGALTLGALPMFGQSAAPAAAAPAAPAAPSWSTTLTPSYASVYMFRGSRLGAQCFQPSISSTYGNWNIGVWASDPINNTGKVFGQSDPEIDPNGTYTITVNDSLNIQPGFTWYTYLRAPTNDGFFKETFEPNIAVNWTVGPVTLTPKYYYDVVLDTATYEFNAAYSIPLKDMGTSLNWAFQIGTYYGTNVVNFSVPRAHGWGNYYSIGVSSPYQLTKNTSLTVGVALTEGSGAYTKVGTGPRSVNTSAVRRTPVTVSYAWTF
jgi:uncharacterized protein (TIGR02001 family)